MGNIRILIVEDELKVAAFIKKGLEENDYETEIAFDGQEGKDKISSTKYDVILMDVNLPVINGFDLCRQIREMKINTPVLMLTAMGTTDNKVNGFEAGADDYLIKPFEFRELVLRIKALIKRGKIQQTHENIIEVADLVVNTDSKTVVRSGIEIPLTAKEFMLLEYFVRNKGRVLSRAEIAEKIWDITFDTGTNVIDVYVNFLRKKIDNDFSVKLIQTKIGMGYYLKEN